MRSVGREHAFRAEAVCRTTDAHFWVYVRDVDSCCLDSGKLYLVRVYPPNTGIGPDWGTGRAFGVDLDEDGNDGGAPEVTNPARRALAWDSDRGLSARACALAAVLR